MANEIYELGRHGINCRAVVSQCLRNPLSTIRMKRDLDAD